MEGAEAGGASAAATRSQAYPQSTCNPIRRRNPEFAHIRRNMLIKNRLPATAMLNAAFCLLAFTHSSSTPSGPAIPVCFQARYPKSQQQQSNTTRSSSTSRQSVGRNPLEGQVTPPWLPTRTPLRARCLQGE